MKWLFLWVALWPANSSALPRVIDVNESTREVRVSIGDYLRFTCTHDYYLFWLSGDKLVRGFPVIEKRSIFLQDPSRIVCIFKVLNNEFDAVQFYYGVNIAECLSGGAASCGDNDANLELPGEFFVTIKHRVMVNFVTK